MKKFLIVLMVCVFCIMPISMATNDLVETAEENNTVEVTNKSNDYEYDAELELMWEMKNDGYEEWSIFLNMMIALVVVFLVLKFSAAKVVLRKLDGEEKEIQKKKINKNFTKEIAVVLGIAIGVKILLLILDLLKII